MFSLDRSNAAREGAALIDRSARGKISLAGADRASFLHSLLTNDIARLKPGSGTYAAYLTPQGRMITDMRIIERGEELLLDVEPSIAESLAARLDKLIFSEDVRVKNVTHAFGGIGVHGPLAAAVLEAATGIPAGRLLSLEQLDNVSAPGSSVTVIRDDIFAVTGFDIYLPPPDVDRLADALIRAGAVPANEETVETLRIEAGRPRFTVDMDTDTIPLEAGIEGRAISLTKGCYVGQEVIVRVLHRGHGRVAKKLVGLAISGDRIPASGDVILAGEHEIGRITSAAFSPKLNSPLALGYVQRDHLEDGTMVAVRSGDQRLEARVRQLGK